MEDEDVLPIELPSLKLLHLKGAPHLLSLVGPKNIYNTNDALRGPQSFFNRKIILPSLEMFKLEWCDSVVKLWSKEIYTPGFQNLKDIKIRNCDKLSSVGSASVFSILVQLETLNVFGCSEMREVISVEETEESEIGEQIIRFPQLKYLKLRYLDKLESFYGGGSKLEFPKLKKLVLDFLESTKRFAKLENSTALFHEKIDFPCLEELRVKSVNDDVMGLWDKQSLSVTSNPAPLLRHLALGSSTGLRQIPSVVLENLSSLTLANFHDDDTVFSSADLGEKEGFIWIYSQLPHLEDLKVEGSQSLKELFGKEDCNTIVGALMLFCGQIKTLELNTLPSLNRIPLHLLKSIASLTLYELNWNYLISADVLEDSLQQLQFLLIEGCHNMEALVINVGLYIKFPKLKELRLRHLACFTGISSTPKKEVTLLLPSLESLEIQRCDNLEHFWSGSIVAPKLQSVFVGYCDNLQQFLVGNLEDTIELSSLESMCFQWCDEIQSISSRFVITPNLREVRLLRLDNMHCLFPGNPNHDGDLQLPSLDTVSIDVCPNLDSFSLRRLLAPKLLQITYEHKEYSMLPFDDLNHFLQKVNAISYCEDEEDFDEDEEDINED